MEPMGNMTMACSCSASSNSIRVISCHRIFRPLGLRSTTVISSSPHCLPIGYCQPSKLDLPNVGQELPQSPSESARVLDIENSGQRLAERQRIGCAEGR